MLLLFNYIFAWIAVLLVFVLTVKLFVRKGAQKKWKGKNYCIRLNKLLKKTHIPMGVMLVIVGLVHGFLSSVSILSINSGTLCLVFSMLLGINFIVRKKLNQLKPWIVIHRGMAGLMIVLLIWHIIDVGGIRIFSMIASQMHSEINEKENLIISSNDENKTDPPTNDINFFNNNIILKDGIYTGTADAYRGTMTVSVTVSSGTVTSIEILSTNDDYEYYSRAEQGVSAEIVENQTLDIDVVSGATYSSQGIINAVNNALSNAVESDEQVKGSSK